MRIAKLLRTWRFHADMKVGVAAEQIGISSSTLSRIESGKGLDGDTVVRLIDWLFSRETEEPCTTESSSTNLSQQ